MGPGKGCLCWGGGNGASEPGKTTYHNPTECFLWGLLSLGSSGQVVWDKEHQMGRRGLGSSPSYFIPWSLPEREPDTKKISHECVLGIVRGAESRVKAVLHLNPQPASTSSALDKGLIY